MIAVTTMLKIGGKTFLSLREASKQTGVSIPTISRAIKAGVLKAERMGAYRMMLVELTDLKHFIARHYNRQKAEVIRRYWQQVKAKERPKAIVAPKTSRKRKRKKRKS
jgi:excisionase family DNA binding protein